MKKALLVIFCLLLAAAIIIFGATMREPETDVKTVVVQIHEPEEVEELTIETDPGHIDVIKARNQIVIVPLPEEKPVVTAASTSSVTPTETDPAAVLAKMVWGEGRNQGTMQKAAIVWCALNRVDAGYGDIIHVVTAPGQFVGYSASNPVDDDILAIVNDVLERWQDGGEGRVLPSDYLWFTGYSGANHFRNSYDSAEEWDWSLPNVYE